MVSYELVHWLTLKKSEKKKYSATTTAYARPNICHSILIFVTNIWRFIKLDCCLLPCRALSRAVSLDKATPTHPPF